MGVAYAFADMPVEPADISTMKRLGVLDGTAKTSTIPVGSLQGTYSGIAREAQAAGIRDVIEIEYRGVPHRLVKLEAEGLLNQGYQLAYPEGQPFIGGTVHAEGGWPVADMGTFVPRYSRN